MSLSLKPAVFMVSMLLSLPTGLMAAEAPKPTSHTERLIEGWKVRVDDRLLLKENELLGNQVLKSLEQRLANIKAVVAAGPVAKLQGIGIVLDLSHGGLVPMQYHPDAGWLKSNGYAENLAKCVHIPVASSLVQARQINVQPWVILHELAHAYHDQVLGFEEPRILAAYKRFKESGRGDKTLKYGGNHGLHYGLTDQKEFFSEMTEAYFGTNDFFPFNHGELKTAEPEIHKLMEEIWGPAKMSS